MNSAADIYRKWINQVIDYTNNNLDHTLSLEELSAVAFYYPFICKKINKLWLKNF